jgi:hypothetical protein
MSEADVALFALVMGETKITAEDVPIPPHPSRQIVPMALVSALLSEAAARLSDQPGGAQLGMGTIRVLESAFTDDTLVATAEISGYDAGTRALRVAAHCETTDGRRLAEGEYLLREG